ncbi:hypothetical protein C8Q76DRAFT_803691 [Earliella scabrosa]|nr:hypothetical protein C8Q76DRAFT_803691 [Earliella scabrosa]
MNSPLRPLTPPIARSPLARSLHAQSTLERSPQLARTHLAPSPTNPSRANIFLAADSYLMGAAQAVHTVVLTVESPTRDDKVTFVLPVRRLAPDVPAWLCQGWMKIIDSPRTRRMGLTSEQRELLLDFCLIYHAFVTRHPRLVPRTFQEFSGHLLDRAAAMRPFEHADGVLADIVYWALADIPDAVILDPIIPSTDDLWALMQLPATGVAAERLLALPGGETYATAGVGEDEADLPVLTDMS